MNKEYLKQRTIILEKIDDIQEGCNGCVTHYEYNKKKDISGLTNACKACPLGQQMSELGQELLALTKEKKSINTK